MGVWETDKFNVSKCPCGAGHLQKIVESPDNPWSSIHVTYELSCTACSSAWDVSSYNGTLTERSTSQAARDAREASGEADAAVLAHLDSLLQSWPFPPFKKKAEEFDYLTEKGLYNETIGKYRFARRTKSILAIAKLRPKSPIVPELVQKCGNPETYESLVSEAAAAKQDAEKMAKLVKVIHPPKQ